ncbi:hypothetical protein CBR_g8597 [Chara braunii]|uniref:Uncharacterized protein n=1 Tax=Chara braunii TaxID=69332 RepID=A0A388JS14_CHABU|nr:hypothetical protein CBR_g8597 [Chara braunii]|eukprot:GBG60575.1 hypothetical protein CBR_g8597 [Chara braunii]
MSGALCTILLIAMLLSPLGSSLGGAGGGGGGSGGGEGGGGGGRSDIILAAVIKAGQEKEHCILAEIRSAVFGFLKKLSGLDVLDPALVSRVRILYVRMLLKCAPELSNVMVRPIESFLEGGSGCTRRPSLKGSASPPSTLDTRTEDGQTVRDEKFRVDYRSPGRRITFKSLWRRLKLQGDANNLQDSTWEQSCMFNRLVKLRDQARNFALGNKRLAALVAHTQTCDLIQQIQAWISHSFDMRMCSSPHAEEQRSYRCDAELLASAIYDGFLTGLGVPQKLGAGVAVGAGTDALGQLLWDYTKAVYSDRQSNRKRASSPLRSPGLPPPSPKVSAGSVRNLNNEGGTPTTPRHSSPQHGALALEQAPDLDQSLHLEQALDLEQALHLEQALDLEQALHQEQPQDPNPNQALHLEQALDLEQALHLEQPREPNHETWVKH